VQVEIAEQESDFDLHTAAQIEQKAEAARLQDLVKLSAALDFPLPQYVEREDDLLPPHFRWTGLSEESLTKAKARLAEIATTLAAMAKTRRQEQLAQDRYAEINARADGVMTAVRTAEDELHDAPTADVEALRTARDSLRTESRDAERAVSESKSEAARVQAEMVSLQQRYTAALARVDRVKAHIAQRKLEVAALTLNNGLLKKVRAARPVIADKLWNIVLSAVGGYFSEIRGERSRVGKDSDGFKVDGHPITSLSGSTKDALGLAIRVALVKTFLPNTPFLLLDEPCAAMDENRTGNLLGFVASCGFTQVIACSHDSLSLSFADHVIQLGD
jgi:DNA repair exonuclease SbcCD ATPase subunit